MALCLFALSSRKGRGGVSRDFVYDSRHRHPRRSYARQEDDRRDASRGEKWNQPRASNLIANRDQGGAWGRETRHQADRGVHGHLFVLVLAVGGKVIAILSHRTRKDGPHYLAVGNWQSETTSLATACAPTSESGMECAAPAIHEIFFELVMAVSHVVA